MVAAHRIFSCGMWDLVLGPGVEPRPLALGAWSLSRWTAREVPALSCCGGCIHEDPLLVGIFRRSVSGCQFQLCSGRTSIPLLSINTVCLAVRERPAEYRGGGGEGSLLQSRQAAKAGSCDGIFLSNLDSTNEASVGKSTRVELPSL